jgi:predicted dithiol-disulfide oxidoreductase (DUF899 family)
LNDTDLQENPMAADDFRHHPVVSHEEWLAARIAFLAKEKEFTRLRDEHNRERRELPWEAVEKKYVFDGPKGKQSLAELFDGRSQLIIYHFMFGPNDRVGCPHCSLSVLQLHDEGSTGSRTGRPQRVLQR